MIVDAEATLRAIAMGRRVGWPGLMLERTETRFGVKLDFLLTADSTYGSAESLASARQTERDHRRSFLLFDKSNRTDGALSPRRLRLRSPTRPLHVPRRQGTGPTSAHLRNPHEAASRPRDKASYRASNLDCEVCELKAQCQRLNVVARKIPRICTRTLETSLGALAATLEYRGRLSASKEKSRCYSPPPLPILRLARLVPMGSEWGKRRVPPRRNCTSNLEAPSPCLRPTNRGSGNAGRVTPPLSGHKRYHPKFPNRSCPNRKLLAKSHTFSTISAKSGHPQVAL